MMQPQLERVLFTAEDIRRRVSEMGRQISCDYARRDPVLLCVLKGAVVFLASEKRAAEYAKKRGIALESIPRIKGWGHRSAPIAFANKVRASAGAEYVFPQVRRAIEDARTRAGVALDQIDAVETHDCFAVTEYMAIDHLGLSAAIVRQIGRAHV